MTVFLIVLAALILGNRIAVAYGNQQKVGRNPSDFGPLDKIHNGNCCEHEYPPRNPNLPRYKNPPPPPIEK